MEKLEQHHSSSSEQLENTRKSRLELTMVIENNLIDKCSRGEEWTNLEMENAEKIIAWREKYNIRN